MEGFARWVVRRRKLVLVLAVVLLVPSVLGALATRINYDILTYLPPELDSMIGETYLEEDFKTASTAMITVEHMTPSAVTGLKKADKRRAGCKHCAGRSRPFWMLACPRICFRRLCKNFSTVQMMPH